MSPSARFLIARDRAGKRLGGVGLELRRPYGLLRSLIVGCDARGSGLGRALVAAAEDLAREHDVRALYLLTMGAQAFFRHLGYAELRRHDAPAEIQQTAEFSDLCPDSATCLRKGLVRGPAADEQDRMHGAAVSKKPGQEA